METRFRRKEAAGATPVRGDPSDSAQRGEPLPVIAPVALFVYNRPWHTRQAVEALSSNGLARETDVHIFPMLRGTSPSPLKLPR